MFRALFPTRRCCPFQRKKIKAKKDMQLFFGMKPNNKNNTKKKKKSKKSRVKTPVSRPRLLPRRDELPPAAGWCGDRYFFV